MKIKVSGKHVKIGSSLESYIAERLAHTKSHFFHNIIDAEVFFDKQDYFFAVSISVHVPHIGHIQATGRSDDAYTAFDSGLSKIEKQLRKYKSKLVDHKKSGIDKTGSIPGTKYVLTPYAGSSSLEEDMDDEQEAGQEASEHVTIAEKMTSIDRCSVAEAIMKMDLLHLPVFVFIHKTTGRLNVVYYRTDGNISWLDPQM